MTDITQTITFDDLIADYDDELAGLREGYDDLISWAEDEYDDQPQHAWPEDVQAAIQRFDQQAKNIQNRQHVLETLRDEYDDDTFELKLLTGSETMDIETEIRMEANRKNIEPHVLNSRREQILVDRATVDAPEAVPTDDDGSPTPSECPSPLVQSLSEYAERLNTAGETDFRAPGFETDVDSSATPTPSEETSSSSAPTTGDSVPRGDDSSTSADSA